MGLHHLAFATRDAGATQHFYEDVLGYPLVRAEAHRRGKGWFKHFFYDIGDGECLAFFEFRDIGESPDWRSDHAASLGLPPWVNHVALRAHSLDELERRKRQLASHGVDEIHEVDHGWCQSVYVMDPNGILVEWCCTTGEFEQPRDEALRVLQSDVEGDAHRKEFG